MKTYALAAVALALMSGVASAAPSKFYTSHKHGGITPSERAAIARSQAHLNALKRQAWADGRLTMFERIRIRQAEVRHNRLVANAKRS
jgi:hypothetical protein